MKIKDSGNRREFSSGFVRDIQEDKPRFDLMWPSDIPFTKQPLYKVAMHFTNGMKKYGERNYELASTEEEMKTFMISAERHLHAAKCGEEDEDHLSAVIFNIIVYMYMQEKLKDESNIHDIYKLEFREEG